MLIIFRKIDPDTGMFTGFISRGEHPALENGEPDSAYVGEPVPNDLWWPRWDGAKWVEGRTAEEVAVLKAGALPQGPTPGDEWKVGVEAALIELAGMIAGGV